MAFPRPRTLTFLGAFALAVACSSPPAGNDPAPGEDPDPDPDPNRVIVTPGPICAEPATGVDRWLLVPPAAHGIVDAPDADPTASACPRVPGALVASDLDGDGDPDLVFGRRQGFPRIFENDGTGSFVEADPGAAGPGRDGLAVLAADLTGDRLPELILTGEGFAAVARNLGGLRFADPEFVWFEETYPVTCYQTASVGDVDGDGDLDMLLPGFDPVQEEGVVPEGAVPATGTWDRLLLGDGTGRFTHVLDLGPPGGPWLSMLGVFTDRDGDGDLDILLMPDRGRDGRPGATFFRNDGLDADGIPQLVDDAAALGADIHPDGMGMIAEDLTGDGRTDYCVSDLLGELRCLIAQDAGGYVEAGAALGLAAAVGAHPDWDVLSGQWSPWSIEALDYDADGDLDILAAAGAPPGPGGVAFTWLPGVQPDALFERTPEGYEDVSVAHAWWEPGGWSYGLAVADLSRDGWPDVVQARYAELPIVRANRCGVNHWVIVDLDGPVGNRQGFGATVEVVSDGVTQSRQLPSLRTVGQSAAELHFGLGSATLVDSLTVRWTDGEITELDALPVDAFVRVRHPSRW
jgi:hypothetical protein